MTYLWEKPLWPSFSWTSSSLLDALVKARHEQGRVLALGQNFVHSYEVSDQKKAIFADLFVSGLSEERLLGWQASLYPTGFAGIKRIKVGELRSKDLVKASLPYKNLHAELQKFLHWWVEPPVELDPLLRSSIAFAWFLFLSPFDEGNFAMAAALAEKTLVENEKLSFRPYDLSLQLEENEEAILSLIEKSTKGAGDLTDWIEYFLQLTSTALTSALSIAEHNNASENFWRRISKYDLNVRQRKIINLMFEERLQMTNRQYVEICKTSRESAKRDLAKLVQIKLLTLGESKGRSLFYQLSSFDS